MSPHRTLGVVGTLVWDRIWRAGATEPVESWGGVAYALSSASAALPPGWVVRVVARVGRDLATEADGFLATIPHVDTSVRVVVPEPNNRVDLRYRDDAERTERLSGGVGAWEADELLRACDGCDGLLVNFISGRELDLSGAEKLRAEYLGPIYVDLHSLLLGIEADGTRTPRRLDSAERWLRCFDAVQVNETELSLLRSGFADESVGAGASHLSAEPGGNPTETVEWSGREALEDLLRVGPGLAFVTRGAKGASWARRADFPDDPRAWPQWRTRGTGDAGSSSGSVSDGGFAVHGEAALPRSRSGDPTGCGDVWGAAAFATLLAGGSVSGAVERANQFAGRSVELHGTSGLAVALGSAAFEIERTEVSR